MPSAIVNQREPTTAQQSPGQGNPATSSGRNSIHQATAGASESPSSTRESEVPRLAAGEWFTARVSSCGLFHIAYPSAPETLKTELRTVYIQLCQDDMPMVRRSAATNLGKFAATVEAAYLKTGIMSMFEDLTQDELCYFSRRCRRFLECRETCVYSIRDAAANNVKCLAEEFDPEWAMQHIIH
ncbi:hypothetical protein F0562_025196 [Nyssa sinensis]|uniref:Condensin complex subunit 1 C-terminal domain-containing protein n=1 Tax=Nyssa sinensis TaxID=561372 RepID=A0A5J5BHE9_9ASTE|nr:hypothetical protein F0562_025196 [Nyssa sinensis]